MSILLNSSNEAYHSNRSHLSSSNLKQILDKPQEFYQEWVLNQKGERESKNSFDEGSFVHTLILEPEKIGEYAIFDGLVKRGQRWEDFKSANPGKTILSINQVARCESLFQNYSATKIATELAQGGLPEHTMLGTILGVPVKSRADYINIDKGYIVDVKTTGEISDKDVFRHSVAHWKYELSAAFYAQIAFENYGKLFDFYWLVLSKTDGGCRVYKASSETLSFGTALYTSAIVRYKKGIETGIWEQTDLMQFSEEIEEI